MLTRTYMTSLFLEFIFRAVFEYIQHWYQRIRVITLISLYKQ